jgi:hypothetical protein
VRRLRPRYSTRAAVLRTREGWAMLRLASGSPFWLELRRILLEEMTDLGVELWALDARGLGLSATAPDEKPSDAYVCAVSDAVDKAQKRIADLMSGAS